MERRMFIKSLAASLAALSFLPKSSRALSEKIQTLSDLVESTPEEVKLWREIRNQFLLNPDLVHLNCGSLGASPRIVIDSVCAYMRELEGDPVHHEWGGISSGMDEVRDAVAQFIGADGDELVLTRNTTEGMNSVATGLGLKKGDEVLTSNYEHGGGMVCWQYLARKFGVKVRYVRIPRQVRSKEQILELVEDKISRKTRVCSFSHVDTITGMQMPLAEIAEITRPKGILLACDGAQAPGMLAIDIKKLGVDTYACSSHKWMLAPKGCGWLFVRKEVQERVQPVVLAEGYRAYNASIGTREVPLILGHGTAVDFQNAIGRERIEARARELNRLLRRRLDEMPALERITPEQPELSSAIVTYALDPEKGQNGQIVERLFKDHGIRIKPAQGTYAYVPNEEDVPRESYNALRFSTHIFNSENDVERVTSVLREILA
jgi:isopenicillin-N epimerase